MLITPLALRFRPFLTLIVSRNIQIIREKVFPAPSFYKKLKLRYGYEHTRYPYDDIVQAGKRLYLVCAEYPDHNDFFKYFGLRDSLNTWFEITTLHIWLCFVRLRQEGKEGRLIKDSFHTVSTFMVDLGSRLKSYGYWTPWTSHIISRKYRRRWVGHLLAYDEGFLAHADTALAAALWRNLFSSAEQFVTFQQLDLAVKYCRRQLQHLDTIRSEVILCKGMPSFLPLVGSDILEPDYHSQRIRHCFRTKSSD
ncbi:unnamed protein product [Protopolystoma xenopodis]|uniref:Ubiquinol-cytochrome c chaperone domain-containing protein n=1 Tax=Protopolystoma xenopodis TaxID=117903 RepID=A0A3S5CJQ9_9PLAT|nr:unnamed protein product [Protopolystoma xenopodis]